MISSKLNFFTKIVKFFKRKFAIFMTIKYYHLQKIFNTYVPVSSSYIRIPRDQKSTALSCPLFNIISGATYSGVPQKVQVFSPGIRNLENPKSTIFTYPSQSSFQNLKIKKCHEPKYEGFWSSLGQNDNLYN